MKIVLIKMLVCCCWILIGQQGATQLRHFFLSVALQYVAPPAAFPHFISVQ